MSTRLSTLDAMRGICALIVVVLHCSNEDFSPVPGGYLAVDFFFVLSGLVVTRAYANRLHQGLSFLAFIKLRLVRLYPLFALGLLIDAARAVTNVFRGHASGFELPAIATSLMRGLLMLPSEHGWVLFRLNSPAWSLAFEMLINVVFALILFRLRSAILALLAGAAFVALVMSAQSHGNFDLGYLWSTAFPGLLRAFWGFAVGMLIARLPWTAPRPSWAMLFPVGVLIVVALVPPILWTETVCIGLVMPMLVYVGARINPPPALTRAAGILGDMSYPVYALHWPLFYLFRTMGKALHLPAPLTMLLIVVLVSVIGMGVGRFFEVPIRRTLSRRLNRTPLVQL